MCVSIPCATQSPGRVRRVVNAHSLASIGGGAALGQIRNSPHEWGQGASGFGKRLASGAGRFVIKTGVQAGVGGLHHEDLHYHRSNLHGTLPRLGYAVKSTFWVPRKNRPGHTMALGRVSGNMSAGLISRAWMPASASGIGAGVASGGIGLAGDVGYHVVREFWPRGKHSQTVKGSQRSL